MQDISIGLAQIAVVKGDVTQNIARHRQAMHCAAANGVDLLVFPELSLTGYEPALAAQLAFTENDPRLQPLSEAAHSLGLAIAVGLPCAGQDRPTIASALISASGEVTYYHKNYLHPGEEVYFRCGTQLVTTQLKEVNIANGICADALHPEHWQRCAELQMDVYLAGVLIGRQGYSPDLALLRASAEQYAVLLGFANHCVPTGGYDSVGKSAFLVPEGILVAAQGCESVLLIARGRAKAWRGECVALDNDLNSKI